MGQEKVFSIVIATYNRPRQLEFCLEAICKLIYPKENYEVVVVDDGSKVSLENLIKKFADRLNIVLLRKSNNGPAGARNAGVAIAKGKYIAFTDDDCKVDEYWLSHLAAELDSDKDLVIGGKTENLLVDNIYSTASQLLVDYMYQYHEKCQRKTKFFTGNNIALSKKLFEKVGGFDEEAFYLMVGEDRNFCERLAEAGAKLKYLDTAKIYHFHYLNLKSFIRQHFNYGGGSYKCHQLRARRKDQQIELEPITFYLQLLLYPFYKLQGTEKFTGFMLFLVMQVANTAGFFYQKLIKG